MRIHAPVVLVATIAAMGGWAVRGVSFDVDPEPFAAPIERLRETKYESFSVENVGHSVATHGGARDLFAYVEAPARPVIAPPPVVMPEPSPVAVVAESSMPVVKTRPKFPHRYIGRFGPVDRPVAAFVRDGDVVTLRIGDRIDEHSVLRAIGAEDVEVETTFEGEQQLERIPLA